MASLFTAATKRAPLDAERRDSAEDRLTEIFGAVLERAPAAACALVNRWVERSWVGDEHRLAVTPQRWTSSAKHRRVDLELRFEESDSCSATVVWVEIKRNARLSDDLQLCDYARDLKRLVDDNKEIRGARLIFLTRRRDWTLDPCEDEDGALGELWPPRCVTWADASGALATWSAGTNRDLYTTRLVQEFVEYLEEEHVATPGLSLEGAIVLQRFEETDDALVQILEATAERLEKPFEQPCKYPNRLRAGGWKHCHWTYAVRAEGWPEDLALEWNLRRRQSGRLCFAAGLTWHGDRMRVPWLAEGELKNLAAVDGFHPYWDDLPRLYRWLQPEELAARGTHDDQVDFLANWVTRTFESLLAGKLSS